MTPGATTTPPSCPGGAEAGPPRWEQRKGKAASSGDVSWEPLQGQRAPWEEGTWSWASPDSVLSERQRPGGSEPGGCSCSRRQVPWSQPRSPGVLVGCWGCVCTLPHTCEAVGLPACLGVSVSSQGAPLLYPLAEPALGAARLRGKGLRLALDTLLLPGTQHPRQGGLSPAPPSLSSPVSQAQPRAWCWETLVPGSSRRPGRARGRETVESLHRPGCGWPRWGAGGVDGGGRGRLGPRAGAACGEADELGPEHSPGRASSLLLGRMVTCSPWWWVSCPYPRELGEGCALAGPSRHTCTPGPLAAAPHHRRL